MNKEKIENIANQCIANWVQHFEKFYQTPLPGDKERKSGVFIGITSLKNEILRALKEEKEKENGNNRI